MNSTKVARKYRKLITNRCHVSRKGEFVSLLAAIAARQNLLAQFPGDSNWQLIFNLLVYIPFVLFILYGQRIQMYVMLREVEGSLYKLKFIREEGRKTAIDTIKEIGKPQIDPTSRVDKFLDYFTIGPQSLDPAGVVWKLEHILDVRDVRFKDEVKLMAP